MSNDLLWLAAQIPDPEVRNKVLAHAVDEFEERDWTRQGTQAGETIVLDVKAALLYDRCALSGPHGDPLLSAEDYWRCRRHLVMDAGWVADLPGASDATARAVGDIEARHGVRAAITFLKEAWTHQLVLSLDHFFFQFHALIRAEAWGMSRSEAQREHPATEVRSPEDRGRGLAALDATKGRDAAPLAAILDREFAEACARLQDARRLRYADFMRSIIALRPIFYSLRDLYWELHFLSGEGDSGEFIERERLVDEWQADCGQVHLAPYSVMATFGLDKDMSEPQVRRHLAFWTRGRVQLNDDLAATARHTYRRGGIAAMIDHLNTSVHAGLDESQVKALNTFNSLLRSHASAG
jgi:hypothetical protein